MNSLKRHLASLFQTKRSVTVIASLLFLALTLSAAEEKKKTSINFEDQLVDGELKKPELFYLLQKKQINFGRLIKLRENFLPEMRRTSEELQRGRSQQ